MSQVRTDYEEHNEQVKALWGSYHRGDPTRVPMILQYTARCFLADPFLNTKKTTFYEYHKDPEAMLDVQVRMRDYIRHNIYADHEMGLPKMWDIMIDAGNFHHSAWYGAQISYNGPDSPDTIPFINEDNKNELFDRGLPDPFKGVYGEIKGMHEYLTEKIIDYEYKGIKVNPEINIPAAYLGGSGVPFTTACKLRGTAGMCLDLIDDPDWAMEFLSYITEAVIERTRAWRKYLGLAPKDKTAFLGDDSCVLLSPEMYKEFVLPFHKRLYEEFETDDSKRGVHLCGNAGRHMRIMGKLLGVKLFDTGFPIDIDSLYNDLGEDIIVMGGIHAEFLRSGSKTDIKRSTADLLLKLKSHKTFILREANSLAPGTPIENLDIMYESCKKYGKY